MLSDDAWGPCLTHPWKLGRWWEKVLVALKRCESGGVVGDLRGLFTINKPRWMQAQ